MFCCTWAWPTEFAPSLPIWRTFSPLHPATLGLRAPQETAKTTPKLDVIWVLHRCALYGQTGALQAHVTDCDNNEHVTYVAHTTTIYSFTYCKEALTFVDSHLARSYCEICHRLLDQREKCAAGLLLVVLLYHERT